MAYSAIGGFPRQQMSFSKKNKKWRKSVVDYGDNHSLMYNQTTRKSVQAMRINYDLMDGKIHMADFKKLLNPYGIDASYIPDSIQHYPIMNSKLHILEGEESRRLFDFKVVITNPTAISEIEEEKNKLINSRLQQLIADTSQNEEDFNQEINNLSDYFQFEYQDKREIRANCLLNHYIKELDIPQLFNAGFRDVEIVGEEIYQCDIIGGEPTIERLYPWEVVILRNGNSCNIEDADMITITQYWSPGKVIDTYYDQLSKTDIEAIENAFSNEGGADAWTDSMGNVDPRFAFIPTKQIDWNAGDHIDVNSLFDEGYSNSLLPYDLNGNIRVFKVYWKSRRKIKKVKSYDPETGEEQFNFYPETYICKEELGEEEQVFWINEAWEGTKIGKDIYVNMRPRPVQYNRLSNPSRCHFGIIGSIYSATGETPYSMVDIMKPFAYQYDVYHDKLNKLLARNVGKAIKLDFAKIPNKWSIDKWLYFLKVCGIAVEDSFKVAEEGPAAGRIAGGMNNASTGIIDDSLGVEITQLINYLDWLENAMGRAVGISPQREGQISNRETVGGVERATLQSSHSTEWIFFKHESVKKRVLECFLETAKIAFKGRSKKFEYILSDGSKQIMDIDGDEFAECDYGLVVDNSNGVQELNQNLNVMAQAWMQNGGSLSTVMKVYTTKSLAEKQRMIETDEKRTREMQQQQVQQKMQAEEQQRQIDAQLAQQKLQMEYQMHKEDLETKILVAQINSRAEELRYAMIQEENGITKEQELSFKNRELDERLKEFGAKLAFDKQKHEDDIKIKEKQIANK